MNLPPHSRRLIASCEYPSDEPWQKSLESLRSFESSFIGMDIGRLHDLTVLWLLHKVGDVFHTRAVICLHKETFDAQEDVLYSILSRSDVRRCCIDQTGIGRQFAERASEGKNVRTLRPGDRPTKSSPCLTLSPSHAPSLRADLPSIRKESTASGNIRFTGERTQNGHADRFWALALALHAAAKPPRPTIFAALC